MGRLLNNFVSKFPHLQNKNISTTSQGFEELEEITNVQTYTLDCNEVVLGQRSSLEPYTSPPAFPRTFPMVSEGPEYSPVQKSIVDVHLTTFKH